MGSPVNTELGIESSRMDFGRKKMHLAATEGAWNNGC